jgi:hypothetical protein
MIAVAWDWARSACVLVEQSTTKSSAYAEDRIMPMSRSWTRI